MTPRHLLTLLAVILVWGFNFITIKIALYDIPPILLCFMRFLLTAFPAIFFIKRPNAPLKKILRYSLIMFVLQFSLLFTAMQSGITPALASIMLQMQAFFAILFGVFFLGEKFTPLQGLGAFIALFGILLVATHIGGDITWMGLAFILGAAATWALGSGLAKTMGAGGGLSLVVWGSLFATPPLLALSLLIEGPAAIQDSLQNLSLLSFASAAYIAYLSTFFGFGVWNHLLKIYPISKLAPFTLLVPIVGMSCSAAIFGEELHYWKIAAAALILFGLCLNLLGSRAPAALKAEEI